MPKKIILIIVILFLIFSAAAVFFSQREKEACFNDYCFFIEIADSQGERNKGLMFRNSLEKNRGMLFIFPEEDRHSFWMKNVLIPLDIVWMGEDMKVLAISKNIQPCDDSSCSGIQTDKETKYVLEINAGMAEEAGIKEGDKMIFP